MRLDLTHYIPSQVLNNESFVISLGSLTSLPIHRASTDWPQVIRAQSVIDYVVMIALIFHSQTWYTVQGGIPLALPITCLSGMCTDRQTDRPHTHTALCLNKHQLNRATETVGFGYNFCPQQFFIIIIKDEKCEL